MLKAEYKELLILVMFSFLLNEVLTPVTIGFVLLGSLLVVLKIRPSKLIRNLFALGLFASYWKTYGKVIDPETGLNFLTSIVVLKLLEKENRRDQYMIFFGLILLISSGSLFERTLTYVAFFTLSFFILIKDFYYFQSLPWKLRDLKNALLWVLPLTLIMFFVTPRLLNPIPYQGGRHDKGEVGYTPNVNISDIENLESNDRAVFQVSLDKKIHQNELYWRGNTISFNDGWNWTTMGYEQLAVEPQFYKIDRLNENEIKQNFRVYNREDFFFSLDVPSEISAGNSTFTLLGQRSLTQKRWQWFNRYEVKSKLLKSFQNSEETQRYLRNTLPKKSQNWIDENIKGQTLSEIRKEFTDLLLKEGFQYSLSPGRVQSFYEFMANKKIGYCSHYASTFALILRHKRIPSRLVSGYMGGQYNRYADAYLVTQNDAHVWVEALVDNKWQRLDPTEWIAPDRVKLGSEEFLNQISAKSGYQLFPVIFGRLTWFKEMKQWIGQWDFKFYQMMEEMDFYTQDAILSRLKLERKWFLMLSPILVACFLAIYMWHISRKIKATQTPIQEAWALFHKKLEKRGVRVGFVSIEEIRQTINQLNHSDKMRLLEVFNELVLVSFHSDGDHVLELMNKIRAI